MLKVRLEDEKKKIKQSELESIAPLSEIFDSKLNDQDKKFTDFNFLKSYYLINLVANFKSSILNQKLKDDELATLLNNAYNYLSHYGYLFENNSEKIFFLIYLIDPNFKIYQFVKNLTLDSDSFNKNNQKYSLTTVGLNKYRDFMMKNFGIWNNHFFTYEKGLYNYLKNLQENPYNFFGKYQEKIK